MKLDDKVRKSIGQRFIVGFEGIGTEPSQNIKTLLGPPYWIGGVILMKRNFQDAEQIRQLIINLKQYAGEAGQEADLIIGTDQEGGLVGAMTIEDKGVTQFPGAMSLGTGADSLELTEQIYAANAKELKLLGIDWVFAPVADVNSNQKNPVIGVRSFGMDANRVGEHVAAAVKGIQSQGVAACLKHFPGHGDTTVDSHLALPILEEKTREQLEDLELIPFSKGIEAGTGSIMMAHMLLPRIGDQKKCASMDPAIVSTLLRERMGYKNGVIVTDCLEMDAVSKGEFGVAGGAVLALEAGCDIAMICHTFDKQVDAVKSVWRSVEEGKSSLSDDYRITEMKHRFAATSTSTIEEWKDKWVTTTADHRKLAAAAYAKTVKVHGRKIRKNERVTLFSPTVERINPAVDYQGPKSSPIRNTMRPGVSYEEFEKMLENCAEHVVYSQDYHPGPRIEGTIIFMLRNSDQAKWQVEVLQKVKTAKEPDQELIVVSTCNPYDASEETGPVDITTFEFTLPALSEIVQ